MWYLLHMLVAVALGFGLGRLKHPAKMKLANIRAEVATIESEAIAKASAGILAMTARIKSLL